MIESECLLLIVDVSEYTLTYENVSKCLLQNVRVIVSAYIQECDKSGHLVTDIYTVVTL